MANSLKVFIGVSILFSIFLVSVFGTKSDTIYETKSLEIQYSDCAERDYSNTNFLDVSNIQEFLKNENFFEGKISGYLDDALLASIKTFQKFTGIRVDGVIGPSTHKAMTSFDPCKRTVNTILIDCGGYLAYKECVWFFGNQNLASEISSTISTTTTIPADDISNMVDCDDGGKMWHGDQGILWNQAGESVTYNNCDEHDEAKKRGYDFTEQPIPGVTPGVGQSITSPSTSLTPTIINLVSVTIAENQKSVVTINATNPLGGSMIYSLSGTDSHLMTVDSDGVIVLNSDANYEEKTSYSVTANVSNSNGTTSKALTISVSDTSEDGIVDLLYVAAGGARDINESDMNSVIEADITTNNTTFTNSQVDITYVKRAFLDSTETFNVTANQAFYDLWQDSDDSKNKVKYGADYVVFFSGKVVNPDPTDTSYRYTPYNGFNPNGILDSSIDNTPTNWSANLGGNLLVTYSYFSCNQFTGNCTGPLIAATGHELGHNLNGNHSRTQISAAASGSGYNFGYQGGVYQDGFRTLMAYNGRSFEQGNDYTLSYTDNFSNPDITCTGDGGGSYACGVENEADLARYLNENKLKYQDMLHKTNLGETTDSYSILSTAYFPLNDGGTATFTDGTNSKTFYTIKGSDTTVSGTTYQTFKWCDDSTCNLSGSDKRIALEIYVNSGNYYLKSQHFDLYYGLASVTDNTIALTFSAPCLFMEKYQVLGDYAEADCNSSVQYFDETVGDSYNFHNYTSKELAYSPYSSYDAKKFQYTYYDRDSHVMERYVFWLSDQVGVVKFLDSNDVVWRLTAVDSDGDGTDNATDTDDDGDGVADASDAFPLDPNASSDADSDGIADGDE
jgi:hypothetical protein